MDTRNEIREFLTSRRARITPEQAGLRTVRRDPARAGAAPRGGRAAGRGQRRLLHAPRARQPSGVSETVLEALARALQLDEAERAHLFDLARAAQSTPRPRRRPAPQGVRPSVQRMLDAMTGAPAFVRNGRMDILAANRLGLRALLGDVRRSATAREHGPVRLPRPARTRLLRRLGAGRERLGRDPALRGRPQPVRPRSLGPRRGAVDAERAVPHALGRAQRPLPRHRHQALPSPGRRRPRR